MNRNAFIVGKFFFGISARNHCDPMSLLGEAMSHLVCVRADPAPAGFRRIFLRDITDVQALHCCSSSFRITRAGTPAAKLRGGKERVTTEPAPTTQPSPIVTPRRTITRVPNHTSRSIRTDADFVSPPETP